MRQRSVEFHLEVCQQKESLPSVSWTARVSLTRQWTAQNPILRSQQAGERLHCKWSLCRRSTYSALPEQPFGQWVDTHMSRILCIQGCDWATALDCGWFPPQPASLSEPSEKLWDQIWRQADVHYINKILQMNNKYVIGWTVKKI